MLYLLKRDGVKTSVNHPRSKRAEKRWRETGSFEAKSNKAQSRSPLKKHEEWLLELVRQEPDLTLEEIQRRLLDERQHKAGLGSVWRFFDRHGISFKKAFGRPSRIGLMLPRRERHGRTINLSSIPTDRSSSTKPAPQPKWRARAASAQRRFGNGTISSGLIAGLRFTDATPSDCFAAWAGFTKALFAQAGKETPGLSSTAAGFRSTACPRCRSINSLH